MMMGFSEKLMEKQIEALQILAHKEDRPKLLERIGKYLEKQDSDYDRLFLYKEVNHLYGLNIPDGPLLVNTSKRN
jgi:hypothetical protein